MQNLKNMFAEAVSVFNERITGHRLVAALVSAFCTASFCTLPTGNFTDISYFKSFSPFWFILIFVLSFAGFTVLSVKFGELASGAVTMITVLALAVFVSVSTVDDMFNVDIALNLGIAAVIFVTVKYCAPRLSIPLELSFKTVYIISGAAAAAFFIITFIGTYCKFASFASSTYDFGIFAQMFEMMKDTGSPMTTVERGKLLSHFAVHFSPIFYLFLPGYIIFPHPEYLLVIQAAAVAAGIFPVVGIARRLGLNSKLSLAAGMFYLLYPSVINGCYYDFHENKLLSVIALYLIYFILSKKTIPMYIFAVLLLCVKEDAAIYIISIALWMIFSGTRRRHGFGILALGAAYFIFAVSIIPAFGGEVMMGRFSSYYTGGDESFLAVIKTCFYNIGYLFTQVFTADRIPFILWMLVPAAAAPFVLKDTSSLLLLIPMLVINLMPDWQYQYDIDVQYTYGVAALVIFCFVMLLAETDGLRRRRVTLFALCCAMVFSFSLWVPKFESYVSRYAGNTEYYDEVAEYLYDMPEDATVTASNFLVPHLYFVNEMYGYPLYYGELQKTDYYLIDTRYDDAYDDETLNAVLSDGYTLADRVGFLEVYRLTE